MSDLPDDVAQALRSGYVALAFAFRRLEGSARSRDTELCSSFLKVRAEIEAALRAHGQQP